MVGVLIRMKLVLLRNSMTGERATWMILGGLGGLTAAAITLALSLSLSAHLSVAVDILALVYAMWLLGWILGPILVGGQSALRADHFRFLPIPRLRLATGLLGTAFVSIGTVVTLLALVSLVTFAVQLGVGPTLVAIPAMVLQLLFVLLLSRVATSIFSAVVQSRVGGAIAGLLLAAMLFVLQGQWVIIVGIIQSGILRTGLPPVLSSIIQVLPSSWALVAVEAASQSNWLGVLAALTGLVVIIALLFAAWSRLLVLPGAARTIVRGSSGNTARALHAWRWRAFSGATMGAISKEVRTWWRDPSHMVKIFLPIGWALLWCLSPLTFGSILALPFTAPALALMAMTSSANLYGEEGTALWVTLLTPGAARHDVRGKQWAWLLIFTPLTILATLVFIPLSGQNWARPWVLASTPALLGGGVGLLVLVSVMALAPGPDPHQGRANPLEQGNSGGQAMYLFFLGLLPPLPALAVVLSGTLLENDLLRWTGSLVGLVTGIGVAWWFGHIAAQRLEKRGPELLSLMRHGKSQEVRETTPGKAVVRPTFLSTMPQWKQFVFFMLCPALGSLIFFAQGLVPLIIRLSGSHTRVWFLALYLPAAWQWPVIIFMLLLGLAIFGTMIPLYLTHKKIWQRLQAEKGSSQL